MNGFIKVIEHIQKKEMDVALKILFKKLSADCIPLIKARGRNLTNNEALSIFYYAFLDLCKRVQNCEFMFEDDKKFITFFKRGCVNQTYNTIREDRDPGMILPGEVLEFINDQAEDELRRINQEFAEEKKQNYGIDPAINDEDDNEMFYMVETAFHLLDDKCKILILLKFFVKLKHEEIADAMRPFYDMADAGSSRVQLNRCKNQIKRLCALNNDE
jgi:hypothetical protein